VIYKEAFGSACAGSTRLLQIRLVVSFWYKVDRRGRVKHRGSHPKILFTAAEITAETRSQRNVAVLRLAIAPTVEKLGQGRMIGIDKLHGLVPIM
jgi:hypothetical protein